MQTGFSTADSWVIKIAEKSGIDLSAAGQFINLPPSSKPALRSLFRGNFFVGNSLVCPEKKKACAGEMMGDYLLGYGFIRFFIEYFREPDIDLGFIINFSGKKQPDIYT